MPGFLDFAADQWRTLPLTITKEECAGKTYIVTGANVGLGYETVKHLVKIGAAKVIIAVRNLESGTKAKKEIEQATGVRGVAEVWQVDLAKSASVRAFAQRATTELDRIDGLIENAGVAMSGWKTAEGYELQLQVNVINTFLMAVLMMPKLSECAKRFETTPHLVIVSSAAGFGAKEEFENIKDDPFAKMNDVKQANMGVRYPLSKLLEIFIVRQLAIVAPLSRTGVVINALSPGLCTTQLARNVPFSVAIRIYILRLFLGRTAEQGSRTLLHAVMAGKESHGCYLGSCESQEYKLESWITDEEAQRAQRHLWDELVQILEGLAPGCIKAIV